MEENNLYTNKHILIYNGYNENIVLNELYLSEFEYLKNNFCGKVIINYNANIDIGEKIAENINELNMAYTDVYICGEISNFFASQNEFNLLLKNNIYIIKELSQNYANFANNLNHPNIQLIYCGQVPINVHNAGVFFRKWFNDEADIFGSIVAEHEFQTLTESNKPTNAFRTGIYISEVKEIEDNKLEFHLLRCSSNLSGPTDNTKSMDKKIIHDVNVLGKKFFDSETKLNHVLAQIYSNTMEPNDEGEIKEKKAKIKSHSDKTKDMPSNGLMAFCSFYQNYNGIEDKFTNSDSNSKVKFSKSVINLFDYVYRSNGSRPGSEPSVLTKLRFRLKSDIEPIEADSMVKQFDIILYPNSIFVMSLKTNRLYTHEIVPSYLGIGMLPIRMGYVVRCSKTKAVYHEGKTFLIPDDKTKSNGLNDKTELVELTEPDEEGIQRLKDLYYKENMTSKKIVYSGFNFSLNKGDYMKPNI